MNTIPEGTVPTDYELIAIYYLINPGAVRLGGLSEMGALEVEASSQHAFSADGGAVDPGIQFLAAFHGERTETKSAVLVALKAIDHPDIEVAQRGGFEIEALSSGGDQISRTKAILRLTMVAMIGQYAGQTARNASVPTFLVGYPTPFIAFAADNPLTIGKIGSADIVVYYVSRGPKGDHHFHAVHWPCPLRD